MKAAVVYYSYDGSTREAARIIADRFGADIFELEEVKKRGHSPASFMAAGFSAFLGKRSRLKDNFSQQMKDYQSISIGTPIWAGRPAPAVNAFANALDAEKKEITIFTLQADKDTGDNPEWVGNIKTLLEKKGAASIKIVRLCGAPPGKTASIEDLEKQLKTKLL